MIRSIAPLFGLVGLAWFLFARNWAAWTNPLVDFGRELYIPWRIVEGQVLYRDIAYLDGPLAPYWNALCFTLFPVEIRTLEMANIAVIAGVSALIFALLQRLIGLEGPHPLERRIVASTGVAFFLCIFAVNLLGTGGNMNWVAPYSHGITHGVALSLLSIWLLMRHLESGRTIDLSLAGFALGLCALTKPEVFAAAGISIGVGMLVSLRTPPPGAGPPLQRLVVLACSAMLPGIAAVGLLALAMPVTDALVGVLGGWSHLAGSDVQTLHFYRWVMGIDEPAENLIQMAIAAGVWASVLVPAFVVSIRLKNRRLRDLLVFVLPMAIVAVAPWSGDWFDWEYIFRPSAVLLAVATVISAARVWRLPSGETAPRGIAELCVTILALVLLGKIFLKPMLAGYAFALLVPGIIVLVFVLLHVAPVAIERRGGDGRLFGWVALAMLALVSLGCLLDAEPARTKKIVAVGAGGDSFMAQSQRRARLTQTLTRWIDRQLPPEATLLVLPEGVIVNYLTRHINPTRHLNFLPPELAVFGEREILEDLEANPPDFVVLVHRDTEEYGLPLFGTDYGRSLFEWAHDRYVRVFQLGSEPLHPRTLRKRRSGWDVRGRQAEPEGQPHDD
ncbi:MAG: hypothetical protein AAEJ52_23145 [Myxococcota bacterium]